MRLFRFLRPVSSAPVARERLQILLEYERRLVSQSDLIAVLREEILAVISRHVTATSVDANVIVDDTKIYIDYDPLAKGKGYVPPIRTMIV